MENKVLEINHYGDLLYQLKKIGCRLHNYRKNTNIYNFSRGYEYEMDLEEFPKKANVEQLRNVYLIALELNKSHPIVNKRYRW